MEEAELKKIWKTYDEKLEKSLALNTHCIEQLQKQKASSVLRPLKAIKLTGIIFGILWVTFVGFLVYHSLVWSKIFFVVSALIHIAISVTAIVVYIKHLLLIKQFDNSETVIEAQQKLVMLQISTMQITRLLLVQLPVFTTFQVSFEWIHNSPLTFYGIQLPIIILFTFAGAWLYKNINYHNLHKKWFKLLFSSAEWTSLTKAMKFMNQIEDFKKI